jgi:hypothetical protein
VVIDDFDIVGPAFCPPETDAELVIDTHAPLPGTITRKLLQPVCGRGTHVLESLCQVELLELAQGGALDVGETPHGPSLNKVSVSSSLNDRIIEKY